MAVFSALVFDPAVFDTGMPPVPSFGGIMGVPVGWGAGRRQGVAGQRDDDIRVERREYVKLNKLRIEEIDRHDIMLFAKTFSRIYE